MAWFACCALPARSLPILVLVVRCLSRVLALWRLVCFMFVVTDFVFWCVVWLGFAGFRVGILIM